MNQPFKKSSRRLARTCHVLHDEVRLGTLTKGFIPSFVSYNSPLAEPHPRILMRISSLVSKGNTSLCTFAVVLPTRSVPRGVHTRQMKRKEPPSTTKSPPKKARPSVPDYHLTPSVREADGSIQWPAPSSQIDSARQFILTW
jgi:hypothetical protein